VTFKVYIPARYASTRLPGKPLLSIAGRPLLQHVYARALESGAIAVVIATDDERIRQCAEAFGATVCMTSDAHVSGTDRLAEAVKMMHEPEDAIIVNLQGDEPGMPAELITQLASAMQVQDKPVMATAAVRMSEPQEILNPDIVKVVPDKQGNAIYFSRAAIPWDREQFRTEATISALHPRVDYYRHLGIYAYRAGFLQDFTQLPNAPCEQAESLEQLRALYHGYKIRLVIASDTIPTGVDTPADLERIRSIWQ
jgi:3-deoxy-manno-octulosonate cytidylyltransferase (CMP-KDO synthetase)